SREGSRNNSVIFTTIIPCDREEVTQDRKIAVKAYPNVAERVKKLLEYHKPRQQDEMDGYLRHYVPQPVEKLIALGILPPIYAHGIYQNQEVSQYDEMMLVCYAFTEGQDLATFLNNQKPLMLGDAVRVKDALMVLYLKIFQAGFSPEFAFYNIIVPDDVSRPFNMIYTDTNNLSREPIRNLDGRLFSAHTGFDDWYSKRGSRQSSSLSNQFSSYSAEKVAALLAELVTTIEDAAQQHRAELNIDFTKLTVEWPPNETRPVVRVLDTSMINVLPAMDSATCSSVEELIARGLDSIRREVTKYSGREPPLSEDDHYAMMAKYNIIFDRPR
ncbi:MAG: hypothetical protein ACK48P_00990, partial [Holosporales bacterium]